MFKIWLVGSCCSLATKQNTCKFWRVVKVQLFIESKERVTSRKCFRFLLFSVGRWSSQLPLKDYSHASFDFVRGFRKFRFLAELPFEFFHNSCLIRWIQQKNYDKIINFTRDWTQISCLAVSHSNHYTWMISVLMWGCNWILFMHG